MFISVKARGETPTCPEGSPTYELVDYSLPLHCGGTNCEKQSVNKGTYFYIGIIRCSSKTYILIVQRHAKWPDVRYILDTLTLDKDLPTARQLTESVFPVYRSFNDNPVIYYKMEDKTCRRVAYSLNGNPKITYDKLLDEKKSSATCKAVQAGLKTFLEKDIYNNWSNVHVCASIVEGPEPLDCEEIRLLKKFP